MTTIRRGRRLQTRSTLRHRLALVAVITTAAWAVALTVAFNVLLTSQLRGQTDDLLRTRAAAVQSTLVIGPGTTITVRDPANDAALDAGVWVFQGSRALDRPNSPARVQRAADALTSRGRLFADLGGSAPARLYAEPVTADGRQVGTVVTATSIEAYRRTSRTALLASALLAILLVVGAYLVTRRVVHGALAPVAEMAAQATDWSASDTARRFGEDGRPIELHELAAGLDALLDRISSSLRHEQQLAAELSHELRTPLAVIAAETDLLREGVAADDERSTAYDVIATHVDRMATLIDDLMAQAAAVVGQAPGRCEVAPAMARALTAAGADSLPAEVSVPAGLEVGVSAEVLGRVLAPLLGNAVRYADTVVSVRAARTAGTVQLTVADDGPGVPESFRDAVFEPGGRADPADGHSGAGLGLALARRLARASGGDIELADSKHGARFIVTLPPA